MKTNWLRTVGLGIAFLALYVVAMLLGPAFRELFFSLGVPRTTTRYLQLSFFELIISISLILLFSRYVAKLTMEDLWISHPQKAKNYLLGYGAGIILFGSFILISLLVKNLAYAGRGNINILDLLIYLPAFAVQSFQEEVLTRGFLQRIIKNKWGVVPSILLPSLLFVVLHLFNKGITFFALVNLFLVGVLFALMVYATGSLWYAAAAHGAWNYVQGIIFGQYVSGIDLGGSLLRFDVIGKNKLINGGIFGPEGSVIVSVILSLGVVYYYLKIKKNKERERFS